ncbi:MAG: hypothetical protein U1B82_10490 [Cypionkella sp.]|nr:hypothetical protein [Cypionkella sp.]
MGVAVEAAAFCPGQAVPLVAIRLAQDPATGQSGLAGMVYMRAFLAAGRKPVGLIDLAHGVLIALAPDGAAGFSVALHDLKAAYPDRIRPGPFLKCGVRAGGPTGSGVE